MPQFRRNCQRAALRHAPSDLAPLGHLPQLKQVKGVVCARTYAIHPELQRGGRDGLRSVGARTRYELADTRYEVCAASLPPLVRHDLQCGTGELVHDPAQFIGAERLGEKRRGT